MIFAYRDQLNSHLIFNGVIPAINALIVITLAIIILVIGMRKLLPLQLPSTASDIKKNFIQFSKSFYQEKEKLLELIIILILFITAILLVSYYVSSFLSAGVRGGSQLQASGESTLVIGKSELGGSILIRVFYKILDIIETIFPLITLFGVLFGIVSVLFYGIFRLGMGKTISVLLTLSLMISSIQLDHLIPFWARYYFRMPFMLGVILLLGLLVKRSFNPGWTIIGATLSGIVLGQGMILRPDFIYFIPIFGITLFCFLPVKINEHLKIKTVSFIFLLAACFLSFSICDNLKCFVTIFN